MQSTTNFGLKKIELIDSPPDITVINPNWDTIDAKLKMAADNDAVMVKKDGSVAMDNMTVGSRATGTIGQNSSSSGINNIASGSCSHAEGESTNATGEGSHSEGVSTLASGIRSHAEGGNCTASSDNAHAEGFGTTASGAESHSGGYDSIASGCCSFVHGDNVKAQGYVQTVLGRYNSPNTTDLFQIGNGTTDNNRKNAMSVDASGNVTFAGRILSGGLFSYQGSVTIPEASVGVATSIVDYIVSSNNDMYAHLLVAHGTANWVVGLAVVQCQYGSGKYSWLFSDLADRFSLSVGFKAGYYASITANEPAIIDIYKIKY